MNDFLWLAEPIDAPDPLFNSHRVPRQVIVDDGITKLKV